MTADDKLTRELLAAMYGGHKGNPMFEENIEDTDDMLQQLAEDRAGWEKRYTRETGRETKPVNMRYLVFFRINNNPDIEIRSINAGDVAKAETFVVNTYGNRINATDESDIQQVQVLRVVEELQEWNTLYLVRLQGTTYSLDANYHLKEIDSRLINQNYTWLWKQKQKRKSGRRNTKLT